MDLTICHETVLGFCFTEKQLQKSYKFQFLYHDMLS